MNEDRLDAIKLAARTALSTVPGISAEALEIAVFNVENAVGRLTVDMVIGTKGRKFADGHMKTVQVIADALAIVDLERENEAAGPHDGFCSERMGPDEYQATSEAWQEELEAAARCLHRIGWHYYRKASELEKTMRPRTSDQPWRKAFYSRLAAIFAQTVETPVEGLKLSKIQGPRTHPMNFLAAISEATFRDQADTAEQIYRVLRPARKTAATSA